MVGVTSRMVTIKIRTRMCKDCCESPNFLKKSYFAESTKPLGSEFEANHCIFLLIPHFSFFSRNKKLISTDIKFNFLNYCHRVRLFGADKVIENKIFNYLNQKTDRKMKILFAIHTSKRRHVDHLVR